MGDTRTDIRGLAGRARAALRRRRLEAGGALILMYHRVAEVVPDPNGIAVRPQRFAGHLELLRRNFEPLSLRTLTRGLRDGRMPKRGIVITFDDGYVDNLTHARPLLERYEVPATVFVVSGQLDAEREFWWDELEQIALGPAPLPRQLAVEAGGGLLRYELGEAAAWGAAERSRHADWSLGSAADPTARHALFRALSDRLRSLPADEARRVVDELAALAGIELAARASHATLDASGVRALAEGGLVEIGSHTATHAKLPALDREARRREVVRSRGALEDVIGGRVRSFAYPFGRASGSWRMVRDAGYDAACSTRPGIVTGRAHRFRLPRLHVGDWEPAELEARLGAWS